MNARERLAFLKEEYQGRDMSTCISLLDKITTVEELIATYWFGCSRDDILSMQMYKLLASYPYLSPSIQRVQDVLNGQKTIGYTQRCVRSFYDLIQTYVQEEIPHYSKYQIKLPPCNEETLWLYREYLRYVGVSYQKYKPLDTLYIQKITSIPNILDDKFCYSFPHVSLEDNTKYMIAFTDTIEKGQKDIQTRCRIGRFASRMKLFAEEKDTRKFVMDFTNEFGDIDVKFARTREEIKEVYTMECSGWSSCMQGESKDFSVENLGGHPAEVYASPDCSVAYILSGKGRLVARSVINEKEKTFIRVYGDDQLESLLRAMGYTSGDLEGCRLLKIHTKKGRNYLMPYLDGSADEVKDIGDYWEVVDCGGIGCSSTYGILEDTTALCVCCNEYSSTDDMSEMGDNGDLVCNTCLNNGDVVDAVYGNGRWVGYMYQYAFKRDCTYVDYIDEWVLDTYLEEMCVWSEHLGEWLPKEYAVHCIDTDDYRLEDDAAYDELNDTWYSDPEKIPKDKTEEVA